MKPETTRGARRLLPRRKRTHRIESAAALRASSGGSPDADFDPVEFAEFLEADDGPMPIDPAFQERLRQELWEMVRERAGREPPGRRDPSRDS